jgi:hypothetical protein
LANLEKRQVNCVSETHHIEVKTIYAAADAAKAGLRLRVLGALTLLAGLAWLYVVWWPVLDRVQMPLMFGQLNIAMEAAPASPQGEKGQLDLAAFNQILQGPVGNGSAEDPAAGQGGAVDTNAAAGESAESVGESEVPGDGTTSLMFAGGVLVFAALAWLGAPTLVGVWLVMAGSSTLGSTRSARTFGKVLGTAAIVGLAGLTWIVWREYQWYESILPGWVKPSMLGVGTAAGVGIGAMLNRRGAWLLRAGGWLVVASACVSVVALWASVRWGRMPGEGIDLEVYLKLFAVQSAYGWLLLLAMVGAR